MHWAAHRNYLNVVDILLTHGADKSILTKKGETPYQLTSNKEIQLLLEGVTSNREQQRLPIIPNYIENPPLNFQSNSGVITKTTSNSNNNNKEVNVEGGNDNIFR